MQGMKCGHVTCMCLMSQTVTKMVRLTRRLPFIFQKEYPILFYRLLGYSKIWIWHYTHENIVLLQDPLGAFLVAGLFWETSKVLRWVAEINHINHVLEGGHKASFRIYTLSLLLGVSCCYRAISKVWFHSSS
jgi:hypothetical protein